MLISLRSNLTLVCDADTMGTSTKGLVKDKGN